ncbi:MAG: hypothetical protein NC218_05775 [Acetobacter sp.]|nr:hypothetical protein [Acetobacter sp.]
MSKPILAAILSCSGPSLTDEEKRLFAEYNPLGITLFSRNLQNKQQVQKLILEIKNIINRDDVLIAVDEEGGRVSRLRNISVSQYVDAETLGQNPIEYAKMHAELISCDMHSLGINVNYAPVVDKIIVPQNNVLKRRCFHQDDDVIVKYASMLIETYKNMGICPCIKHLPTHFSITEDPHLSLVKTELSLSELKKETNYLQKLCSSPMAMTAHIFLKSIDSEFPTTMSKKVISEFLRGYLNFDNFLISDAIDMHALFGNISQRASLSLDAGVDAVCYCSGIYQEMYAICKEKRFMTEKSLIRFAKIKNIIHNAPKDINVENVKKRYDAQFEEIKNISYDYDATETLNQMLKKGESL